MAGRTARVQARVEPALKRAAEGVFWRLGLTSSDATRLFYKQVELRGRLPFPTGVPNRKILAAMRELERGGGKRFRATRDLFSDWEP